ncbi:glycosyltransferase family 117 protein [Sphingobacterium faecium]|uniref:glycosyltransferase family 117 protein n=1 Tax=Sphingobacterium faecium TaxID=34087 RepID=UPI000B9A9B23|nr:DUF2723 domain-containing protein [Sphingobacterium faecium]WGQ13146.1 DUF2723 domain-containing protein [Sphingobacterium faecium]HCU44114.1 DUF2723 domain-containing protein [Sphingobacterium sp.]
MSYQKVNNMLGWLCAIIATVVFIITAERTTSWWDTGEFIASAYKLQIVHQPGAPLFLMVQNIFSNFALGNVAQIAFWMNIGSAVCSGLTVLFLFWTITALGKKISHSDDKPIHKNQVIKIMGAGLVGALAYSFSDTFWYSAVESEVYAMSSLCTAVVFWAILKWEARANKPQADRWLIVIAYIIGLSIGVHLLNLLVIPAIALIIYFKKTDRTTLWGISKAMIIGLGVLALILWGVIQYLIKYAAKFDLFFVNTLGLAFGSGILVFVALILSTLIYGIYYSIRKGKVVLNTALLATCFILLGYSSFTMVLIRANANPSLNNNDPKNVFSFLGYLSREQYESEPLIKGPYFDANPTGVNERVDYRKDSHQYAAIKRSASYQFDRETIFPRIYSQKPYHQYFYKGYLGIEESRKANFADNLKFFFNYQIGHLYARYFLWNFVGRQNDQQGNGSLTEGNWLSGIRAIDNLHLGGQSKLSDEMIHNPTRNTYFFLPLLIGLAGAFWHFKRNKKDAIVVGLLFVFTGLAIVIYLNQSPLKPRERDYAYAGSFYAFAIWIGLGVFAISELLKKYANERNTALFATSLCLFAAPLILINQNWDDHNRSEKSLARDVAKNYLETCAPNAILFTYGDHDTFPLWYLQEVEGVRRDVRIVVISYLTSDWYFRQVKNATYQAAGLPITIPNEKVAKGIRESLPYHDLNLVGSTNIKLLLDFLLSDSNDHKLQMRDGQYENFLPTKQLRLAVNKSEVIKNRVVPQEWENEISNQLEWTFGNDYVTRADLGLMSVLANNNWQRPIYFSSMVPSENLMGLDKYMVDEGFAKRLMPIDAKLSEGESLINIDKLYKNIVEKYAWGNIHQATYIDTDSFRFAGMYAEEIFGKAARTLFAQGKTEQARQVAVKAFNELPQRLYSMADVTSYVDVIDTLYKTGESKFANQLVDRNLKFLTEHMDYYQQLATDKPETGLEVQNIKIALDSVDRYERILANTKEKDRYAYVADLSRKYKMIYLRD